MSADSLQTDNIPVNGQSNVSKVKTSVSAGFRLESSVYNDLVATFKTVNNRNPKNQTELYLSAIQYYRQHARLVNSDNAAIADLTNDLVEARKELTTLRGENNRLQTDYTTLHESLAKHFLIEETELTRAMVIAQKKRAAAGKPRSKDLTEFTGYIFEIVREAAAPKELLQ